MEEKRFRKADDGFVCSHCGKVVPPLGKTSRDHCPFCLYSRHMDIFPGDRKNTCLGELIPRQVYPDPKKGYIIEYECEKCRERVRNKAALSGNVPDDTEKLIALTVNPDLI